MLEAIAIVSFLAILIIIFYPRPSSLSQRKRKSSDDKPYWLDKHGY